MNQEYWQNQLDKPLFPNLLWSRPETKHGAGKILIIGGQAQEFIHVAASYTATEKAGAGVIRVLMPSSTQKITKMLPNIEYAPSNTSGSFAKSALIELIAAAEWADTVLIAGDLGKNSETNLMLEAFMRKHTEQLIIAAESIQSITLPPADLFLKENTTLVLTFGELQKYVTALKLEKPLTSSIGNPDFALLLHEITANNPTNIVTIHGNNIWAACGGVVSLTKSKKQPDTVAIAAESAVWQAQNPNKPFEALTTAIWQATR